MAVITFERANAAHLAQRAVATLKAASACAGRMIDTYVSYRMQAAASEAEQGHTNGRRAMSWSRAETRT